MGKNPESSLFASNGMINLALLVFLIWVFALIAQAVGWQGFMVKGIGLPFISDEEMKLYRMNDSMVVGVRTYDGTNTYTLGSLKNTFGIGGLLGGWRRIRKNYMEGIFYRADDWLYTLPEIKTDSSARLAYNVKTGEWVSADSAMGNQQVHALLLERGVKKESKTALEQQEAIFGAKRINKEYWRMYSWSETRLLVNSILPGLALLLLFIGMGVNGRRRGSGD